MAAGTPEKERFKRWTSLHYEWLCALNFKQLGKIRLASSMAQVATSQKKDKVDILCVD